MTYDKNVLGTREKRTAAGQQVDRDGAVIADKAIALNMPLIHRLELSEREIEMATQKILQEVERYAHTPHGRRYGQLPGRDDGPGRSPRSRH